MGLFNIKKKDLFNRSTQEIFTSIKDVPVFDIDIYHLSGSRLFKITYILLLNRDKKVQ
jgi:hypothetical protein